MSCYLGNESGNYSLNIFQPHSIISYFSRGMYIFMCVYPNIPWAVVQSNQSMLLTLRIWTGTKNEYNAIWIWWVIIVYEVYGIVVYVYMSMTEEPDLGGEYVCFVNKIWLSLLQLDVWSPIFYRLVPTWQSA